MSTLVKTVTAKNLVKKYSRGRIRGRKFYVRFADNTNAMFDHSHFKIFDVGDQIEFQSVPSGNDWLKVNASHQVKKLQTVSPARHVDFDLEIGYVSKPKTRNGKQYVVIPQFAVCGSKYMAVLDVDKIQDQDILNGYGHIVGSGTLKSDMLTIDNIKSFDPILDQKVSEFLLSEARYANNYVVLCSGSDKVYVDEKDLPFDVSSIMNAVKSCFKGKIKVVISSRKKGTVKNVRGQWIETFHYEATGTAIDCSDVDIPNITKVVQDRKSELAYQDLMRRLRSIRRFHSFVSIKKTFRKRGFSITDADIKKIFYHPQYDAKCFEILEKMANDIFVNHTSFVFVIRQGGNEYRIVEKPSAAAATYVFDNTLGLSTLLKALQSINRSTIRSDQVTQQQLGFVGFAKHNPKHHGTWRWKIKEVVEESFAKQLEQKFTF